MTLPHWIWSSQVLISSGPACKEPLVTSEILHVSLCSLIGPSYFTCSYHQAQPIQTYRLPVRYHHLVDALSLGISTAGTHTITLISEQALVASEILSEEMKKTWSKLDYTHIIRLIRRKVKLSPSLATSATLTANTNDTCIDFSGYNHISPTSTTTMATSNYFAAPHSIQPLPQAMHNGLIGVGICGLASFLSTLTLFSFLVYRIFTWRAHYKTFLGYN